MRSNWMSVGLQHRWMDSRSIDQRDRVVCMNVKNGDWSRSRVVGFSNM